MDFVRHASTSLSQARGTRSPVACAGCVAEPWLAGGVGVGGAGVGGVLGGGSVSTMCGLGGGSFFLHVDTSAAMPAITNALTNRTNHLSFMRPASGTGTSVYISTMPRCCGTVQLQ
jgi:hypothetical protein